MSQKKIEFPYLNIGSGDQISIKNLAFLIKKIVGFKGQIYFNTKYSDGVRARKLDIKKINQLGWSSKISLSRDLKITVNISKMKFFNFEFFNNYKIYNYKYQNCY